MASPKNASGCPCKCSNGYVYTPYRVIRGARVYHPGGGVYRFKCRCCAQR